MSLAHSIRLLSQCLSKTTWHLSINKEMQNHILTSSAALLISFGGLIRRHNFSNKVYKNHELVFWETFPKIYARFQKCTHKHKYLTTSWFECRAYLTLFKINMTSTRAFIPPPLPKSSETLFPPRPVTYLSFKYIQDIIYWYLEYVSLLIW